MNKQFSIQSLTQDRLEEALNLVLKAELDTREEIEHHLEHIEAHYVAVENGKIVGVIGWYQDNVNYAVEAMGDRFPGIAAYWVGFFAVDETCKGRGIGKALLAKLEKVVREKGVTKLWVSSVPETRDYYIKQGFNPVMEGEISGNRKFFLMKDLKDGEDLTKKAYEDPQIVAGYIQRNAVKPKLHERLEEFAKKVGGKKVIDVGCGPGHDSYKFADLGFTVTGMDYSERMIQEARRFKDIANKPEFIVGDMRELSSLFGESEFDGAWVSASLLHIREKDVPKVLSGLRYILKNGARVYIGLKGGKQGSQVVREEKYGVPMEREFIFWEKDKFLGLTEPLGFKLDSYDERVGSKTGTKDTNWMNFEFVLEK